MKSFSCPVLCRLPRKLAAGSSLFAVLVFGSLLGTIGFGPLPANASEGDESKLTVERIFAGKEFSEESFGPARWLPDSSGYVVVEKSSGKAGGQDLVLYTPESDQGRVLVASRHLVPAGETAPLTIDDYQWSHDGAYLLIYTKSKRVWRAKTRGDYWVFDINSHELRQLGLHAAPSTLMFATFSPVDHRVAYVHERNIYVEDWRANQLLQLTEDGSEHLINGTFDWVYEEEFRLRKGFKWSPDGQKIAYWQINTEGVGIFHLIDNLAGLYPRLIPIPYPKVGETNPACRVGIVDTRVGGQTGWIKVTGDPRENYLVFLEWVGRDLMLQQLNRLQNTNRLFRYAWEHSKLPWIASEVSKEELNQFSMGSRNVVRARAIPPLDPYLNRLSRATQDPLTEVLVDRDDAWVEEVRELHWLKDKKRFLWISERDGWRHLYRFESDELILLTDGDYDITELKGIDEKSGQVYFMASPDNPTQRYLYRIPLTGGKAERVTASDQAGVHSYQISPDYSYAIHSWSSANRPLVRELISLADGRVVRSLTDNSKMLEALKKLDRQQVDFFRVDIGEGVELDGWMIKPTQKEPGKKYPLLVFVYGEPAGQTVMDRWGGNRYLWHLMHAQNGYCVMSFDNRGTPAPRGRAWRKIVYRQVGILAPQEQAAALDEVLQRYDWLDPERVGVWGWSGGGSMTLNMMFKYPEKYSVGLSVAPVPNQRYYDTIYQERYMGLPKDNVKGYRDGSSIHYASQLKGDLLLVHGTGDDNVHYQGTEALIDELVALGKDFSMLAYPNRAHSIREGVNTTPHLYGQLTRYLYDHLPAGGR